MGQINPTLPVSGVTPNSTADPEVVSAFNAILGVINGGIDATNLSTALAQAAAVNQASQVVKGATNIPTAQSTSSNVWVTLATPDQVTGIVLPANGLIRVWYQATWQESVSNGARAAIFLNSNQVKGAFNTATTNASASPLAAAIVGPFGNPAGVNVPLFSFPLGLTSPQQTSGAGTPYGGDVTTGQVVGGLTTAQFNVDWGGGVTTVAGPDAAGGACDIFAAAGTYTVSVQFKASSGSLTASNRKLWVQAISFA